MKTSGMKSGDIVKVDDGLVWFAEVVDMHPLTVRALHGATHRRRVTARQITGHWRKTKATIEREGVID